MLSQDQPGSPEWSAGCNGVDPDPSKPLEIWDEAGPGHAAISASRRKAKVAETQRPMADHLTRVED